MNANLYLSALLPDERSFVVPMLHGVICDMGGWILSRSYFESAAANVIFEFPRDLLVEMYSALVSLGFELAPSSHLALAETCRCTPYLFTLPSQSKPILSHHSIQEAADHLSSLEIVKIELDIEFGAESSFGLD